MIVTEQTYYISEIFESIQGEGNFSGVKSLFIRFHFCNLSCIWCDTRYTWLEKSGNFKKYTADELREIINKSSCYHVIFTGGEPSLYRLDLLVTRNKKFHVESNGYFIPCEAMETELSDGTKITRNGMQNSVIESFNWVISPKLSNSRQQLNEKSLSYWATQEFCIFKFIVKSAFDLEEVEQVIDNFRIDKKKVYIGMEGFTVQSQLNTELVEEIIKRGFNFSPRLHILFWGAARGK